MVVGVGVAVEVGVLVGFGVVVDIGVAVEVGLFVGVDMSVGVGFTVIVENTSLVLLGSSLFSFIVLFFLLHPIVTSTNIAQKKNESITFTVFIQKIPCLIFLNYTFFTDFLQY